MFIHSIRGRLQVWYGLFLVLLLAGFGFTAYQLERSRLWKRVDDELAPRVGQLLQELRTMGENSEGPPGGRPPPPDFFPDGPDGPGPRFGPGPGRGRGPESGRGPAGGEGLRSQLFNDASREGFYLVTWRRDGEPLARSTNTPSDIVIPPRASETALIATRTRGTFREAYQFTPPGECVLAGRSISRDMAELRWLGIRLTGVGLLVLGAGLAGGWWLVGRAIAPIRNISDTAVKIAAGDLSQRVNAARADDELGELAAVLNSTFARLEAAFGQQARFTSDAAHELRTPVSVMLTQTQASLTRPREAADYRETVESCQRAAQRMRRLIESMLELARLDAGQEKMKRQEFDLSKIARECVDLVQPLAAERRIRIQSDLTETICHGDPDRLAQVITNLLTNAIHYNKDEGEIRVQIFVQGGLASLSVSDTGEGISPEGLARLGERFYRADKSRSGKAGRTGLGIAISKAIVEAHGGTIEITSQAGEGSTFTLKLPV